MKPATLPEFKVIERIEKNQPKVDIQGRLLRVVIPAPRSKEEILQVARHLYEDCKQDIEATQRDAKYKGIAVSVYDSDADAEDNDGNFILHVEIPDLLSPTLPEWNGATILWKWRLPEYRPTELQLKIFSEYWRGYYAASVSAHSKFVDSNGVFIGTPKDIPLIQRRRKLAERRLPKELMKRHKLTQPELEQMLAYVWVWRHGEKPTDELIEQTVATFREEWRAPPP